MRIWIVNHYALPPGSRGGPTRHLGLSRALRDRGHEVTVVASLFDHYRRENHRPHRNSGPMVEDIDGVCHVWIPTPSYRSTRGRIFNMIAFAARVAWMGPRLALPDPDVIIGSSPHLLAPLAAKYVAKRRHAGFVMEVRDLWPESLVELGELSDRHPAVRILSGIERHLYRSADEVVTVLPNAAEHLLERGAVADHLHVVPNGVEVSDSRAVPRELRASDHLTAVYAGTMGLANGLDLVVDAGEILVRRGRTDIAIRLVGEGPERAALAARAASVPTVSVESSVPAEEVPSLLRKADVGLLVLRDSPIFRWGISPTKLFDYMAASLPVITSVRAPSDVVSDIDAGMRAEPGDASSLADALERMAALPPERLRAMGERGREHVVDHHSFEALAAQIEAVAAAATRRTDLPS